MVVRRGRRSAASSGGSSSTAAEDSARRAATCHATTASRSGEAITPPLARRSRSGPARRCRRLRSASDRSERRASREAAKARAPKYSLFRSSMSRTRRRPPKCARGSARCASNLPPPGLSVRGRDDRTVRDAAVPSPRCWSVGPSSDSCPGCAQSRAGSSVAFGAGPGFRRSSDRGGRREPSCDGREGKRAHW